MHLRHRRAGDRRALERSEDRVDRFLNARSTSATASSEANGGTWSWSFASSPAMSGGRRSRRVESTCPNLTKIGPSVSSARRSRTARGASNVRKDSARSARRGSRPAGSAASANSSRPKRNPTQRILARRRARRTACRSWRKAESTGNHAASQNRAAWYAIPRTVRAILRRAFALSEIPHASYPNLLVGVSIALGVGSATAQNLGFLQDSPVARMNKEDTAMLARNYQQALDALPDGHTNTGPIPRPAAAARHAAQDHAGEGHDLPAARDHQSRRRPVRPQRVDFLQDEGRLEDFRALAAAQRRQLAVVQPRER